MEESLSALSDNPVMRLKKIKDSLDAELVHLSKQSESISDNQFFNKISRYNVTNKNIIVGLRESKHSNQFYNKIHSNESGKNTNNNYKCYSKTSNQMSPSISKIHVLQSRVKSKKRSTEVKKNNWDNCNISDNYLNYYDSDYRHQINRINENYYSSKYFKDKYYNYNNDKDNNINSNSFVKLSNKIDNKDKDNGQITENIVNNIINNVIKGENTSDKSKSVEKKPLTRNISRMKNLLVNNIEDLDIGARTIAGAHMSKVIDAYRNRRIFTVYGRNPSVREALLCRGWLEKLAPAKYPKLQSLPEYMLNGLARKGYDYEAAVISKIIKNLPAFFIWQPKALCDQDADVLPHRNRIRRAGILDFCSKIGLIGCAEIEKWYWMDGLSEMKYPRFYCLTVYTEGRDAFIEDFRYSQCRSVVRYVTEHRYQLGALVDPITGTVGLDTLTFAVMQLKHQLNYGDDSSLDKNENVDITVNSQWKEFLSNSALVLRGSCKFKAYTSEVGEYLNTGQSLLDVLDEMHPDYKWDGCRNLWILKPGFRSCGNGIFLKNSLEDILKYTMNNSCAQYIAQKYIEIRLL